MSRRSRMVAQQQVNSQRITGLKQLSKERWYSHNQTHRDLARALADYKTGANEWRATVADIRGALVTRTEYAAEHKALKNEMLAILAAFELRLNVVESTDKTENDQSKAIRNLLTSARNTIVLGFIVLGGLIGLLVYLKI